MRARYPVHPGALDIAIAELASRQHGVLSREQLRLLGASPQAVETRLSNGRLHSLHRGVYLAGHRARAPYAEEMAAVLACGEGAVISHRSALHLWSLVRRRPERPHITLPRTWKARRPGIVVHSTATLETFDLARSEGIPLTRPARALVDVAATCSLDELERLVGAAIARDLVRPQQLREQLRRRRGQRGIARLRAVLAIDGGPAFTRSSVERRFLRLLRGSDLPVPQVNFFDGTFELDFLWQRERLVVEIDTFSYHSDPPVFERDRLRDAELEAQGYGVIRITDRQLSSDPDGVIARLRRALAIRRPARSGSSP